MAFNLEGDASKAVMLSLPPNALINRSASIGHSSLLVFFLRVIITTITSTTTIAATIPIITFLDTLSTLLFIEVSLKYSIL